MKTILNRVAFITCLLILFLCIGETAMAQSSSGGASTGSLFGYWLLGGSALIFLGVIAYTVRNALVVLHDHGKSFEFSFPMFGGMAKNSKTVTIVILIIVLSGIIWAVNYGG